MSGFLKVLRCIFIGPPPKKEPKARSERERKPVGSPVPHRQRSLSVTSASKSTGRTKVELLQDNRNRPPKPYWQLRGWRRLRDNLYLGYFKTRLGRCHGIIKWDTPFNYSVYVHDVPSTVLTGPHGGCFTMVKPRKYRVHFAQEPKDLNALIFYIEILLMEGFSNEKKI